MLVWHIDYNPSVWTANKVNNNSTHQYVDMEEADGTQDEFSRASDSFPGEADITSFTDETTPSMRTWSGKALDTPITDITEDADGIIRFKVKGGRAPIQPVKALQPEATGAVDFTAQWEPSTTMANATYRLKVYRKTEGVPTDIKTYNIAGSNSLTVDGLLPDTYYHYTVAVTDALEISEESNEITVFTGHLTIDNFAVKALDPEPATITANSFTAMWEELDDAINYNLSVYTKVPGDPLTDLCAFDNKLLLPEGWATDATATYSMASYAGAAIPSLRLGNGQSCTTPHYDAAIKSIAFWQRGSSASTGDKITVKAITSGGQQIIATLPVETAKGGKTETITNIPAGTIAIEISYAAEGTGSLAIDDICVKWGNSLIPQPQERYDNISTGNVTSYEVNGLEPDTNYFFTVTATDGNLLSKPSQEIAVHTSSPSGIQTITVGSQATWQLSGNTLEVILPDGAQCTVCDIAGRIIARRNQSGCIHLSSKGIYIINCTGTTPAVIRI